MKTQQRSNSTAKYNNEVSINDYALNFILAGGTLVGTVVALYIISKCF